MNDRELLELAAKAAGIVVDRWLPDGSPQLVRTTHQLGPIWSPFTDDGDALRLAVKLKLDVWRSMWPSKERYVAAHKVWNPNDSMYYDDGVAIGEDPYAATRRAIVRAAAEIGKAMK